MCGVGYPTSFFVQSERPGFLTTNAHFGWHYQQETLAEPQPCMIPIDKPRDGIRVFILGESAAMGTQLPEESLVNLPVCPGCRGGCRCFDGWHQPAGLPTAGI